MAAVVSMTLSTKLTHLFSSLPSPTPQQLSRISLNSDSVETLLHYRIRNMHSFPQTKHSIHQSYPARKLKNWKKKFLVACLTFFLDLWYSLLSLLVSVSGGVAAGGKIGSVVNGNRKAFPATTQEYLFQGQGTFPMSHWKIVLWRTNLLRSRYLLIKESMVKVGRDLLSITEHLLLFFLKKAEIYGVDKLFLLLAFFIFFFTFRGSCSSLIMWWPLPQ